MCLAARTRLSTFEHSSQGGLGIGDKFKALDRAVRSVESFGRLQLWFSWFHDGMLPNIHAAATELGKFDLSIRGLLVDSWPQGGDTDDTEKALRQRKIFQKTVRGALFNARSFDRVERMRHKLGRWDLPGLPGRTAERCCRSLDVLRGCVPRRVCSAVLRTFFNGWCTGRRFQGGGSCCFACGAWPQEDSIEHYSTCAVVRDFARRRLNICPRYWSRGIFVALGLNYGSCSKDDLTRRALLVYSVYKAHNLLRYKPLALGDSAIHLLSQFAVEGAMGNSAATGVLDGAFETTPTTAELDVSAYSDLDVLD